MSSTSITPQQKNGLKNAETEHALVKHHIDSSQINGTIATAPGTLKAIKRNGKISIFNPDKIKVALTKAFLAVEGQQAAASTRIHQIVEQLTGKICDNFDQKRLTQAAIHIEEIQDQVELALMDAGEYKVLRAYVLYRDAHRKDREAKQVPQADKSEGLQLTQADGSHVALDQKSLQTIVEEACHGLEGTQASTIIEEALPNLFDGATQDDLNKALILTSRTLIEKNPDYSFVTARLLLGTLRKEALSFLDITPPTTRDEMGKLYPLCLKQGIDKGIELGILNPQLAQFDLARLGQALKPERDLQFTYLGLQTLYDRYFIHHEGTHYEVPQTFFMRVAMGLALEETDKEQRTIEFYQLLSSFDYMSSTPTLFNSGTIRPQLSSCVLTTVADDLD